MSLIAEQKILLFYNFNENMEAVVAHGLKMARLFKKELCVFATYAEPKEKANLQLRLAPVVRDLQAVGNGIRVSSLTLKGTLADTIAKAAEAYDAILLVLSKEDIKAKVKALQNSRIPFLFVDEECLIHTDYKQVMLPLDYRKVMKNGSVWASYFVRFNETDLLVYLAKEKDHSNAAKLQLNVSYLQKLLGQFGLGMRTAQSAKSSFFLPMDALALAKEQHTDLLIVPASQKVNLIDMMIGLPETKLLKKSTGVTVMCINPSHDMLVMCD